MRVWEAMGGVNTSPNWGARGGSLLAAARGSGSERRFRAPGLCGMRTACAHPSSACSQRRLSLPTIIHHSQDKLFVIGGEALDTVKSRLRQLVCAQRRAPSHIPVHATCPFRTAMLC